MGDAPVSRRKKKQCSSEDDVPVSRRKKKRNSSIDEIEISEEEEAPLSKRRGKSRTSDKRSKGKRDSPHKESSRRSGRERRVVKESLADEDGDDSEKQPSDHDSDFQENTNESSQEDDLYV